MQRWKKWAFALTAGFFCAAADAAPAGKELSTKEKVLQSMRKRLQQNSFRYFEVNNLSLPELTAQLQENGVFADLESQEKALRDRSAFTDPERKNQNQLNEYLVPVFRKIRRLAEEFRNGKQDPVLRQKLRKAILHYGALERSRPGCDGRFHGSCFAIPVAAVNIYFSLLPEMEAVEKGICTDPEAKAEHKMLQELAMQCFEQPPRRDDTDNNIISIDRFRKHIWWVGGNGLSYRPVLETGVMMNSVPIIDVIADVAHGALSVVSQNTYDTAFWTEGFTADGAGWGHGKQALVWGYPIHGGNAVLQILAQLRNTPWAQTLGTSQKETMLNLIRGLSFYYWNGWIPPVLDRNSCSASRTAGAIETLPIAKSLLKNWRSSFTPEEIAELEAFIREADSRQILMRHLPAGNYYGSRYFFNNDDMIRKSPDKGYYSLVNMASSRVDGLESAIVMADGFNLFTCDGSAIFLRSGGEYQKMLGAMEFSGLPGITARRLPNDQLQSTTNWRGFCSEFDFAAGATRGGDYAAGFPFRKYNASAKPGVNDTVGLDGKNEKIFGVDAWKSYFFFGDTFLALGCGITDNKPEYGFSIMTSLDQTSAAEDFRIQKAQNLDWIINNQFAYAILPDATTGTLRCRKEVRRTNWQRINLMNFQQKTPETDVEVLDLAIDHGTAPKDAAYAYVVQCDGNVDAALPVILSNTKDIQAAQNAAGNSIGAVFYNAGSILKTPRGDIRVTAPCAILLEYLPDSVRITVTDGKMDPDCKTITVAVPGAGLVEISMPSGAECGKPVSVQKGLQK
ncbi:MAG: hypothetical protein J6R85_02920 [Lentisphaeria bacterium]|nr:hypothetical protein [Lentisphaeria bacterium]